MTMRLNLGKGLFALSLLGVGLMLSGCPTISSPKDWASHVVGNSFEQLLVATDRIHSRDRETQTREDLIRSRYSLANGNVAYVDRFMPGRCNVHWEVNPAGIIVGYRYEEVVKGGCNW